jgi:Asp-tRNA(Asn)/Glu-tRNA(Gln) amidotransferase A subunit family amidase
VDEVVQRKMGQVPGLNFETTNEVTSRVARGKTTVRAVVDACLARIDAREPAVHALTYWDARAAIAQAESIDRHPGARKIRGLVAGVKDVIDTADMPTCYGSAFYEGHRPSADAVCVSNLRRDGALVLCKTVTAEFAGADPVPTANPLDLMRTPGGSSSGSAAAVADGMIHIALSTQTGGSTIRPASYCGVVGFKPTFGLIDRTGIKLISESLDTVGVMARDVAGVAMAAACASGTDHFDNFRCASPRHFLICQTPFWSEAEVGCRGTLTLTERIIREGGAPISALALPSEFETANDSFKVIMSREASRALAYEISTSPDLVGAFIREFVRLGAGWSASDYKKALGHAESLRKIFSQLIDEQTVIVTPSASGSAPRDRSTTGSPVFNSIWTMLHAPCLTVPVGRDDSGMPIGVQLVAKPGCDGHLLACAAWLEGCARANANTFINQRSQQLTGADA